MKVNQFTSSKPVISEEKLENIQNLKEIIKDSVDNPPSQEQIQAAKDNFKAIIADGVITAAEKEQIKTSLQENLNSLGITESELQDIKSAAKEVFEPSPLAEKISEKKDNLANLKQVIQDSVDNPPSQEQIQLAKDNFKDIIADGVITPAEKEQIKTGIKDVLDSLGVSDSKLEEIILKVEEIELIRENSPFPKTFDGFLGKDRKDSLTSGFNKDVIPLNRVVKDFSAIKNLGVSIDTIDLNLTGNEYSLGAISSNSSDILSKFDPAVIDSPGNTNSTPKLLEILSGTGVSDLNSRFEFF